MSDPIPPSRTIKVRPNPPIIPPPDPTPEPTGAELIAIERQRQIDVEGWTPEHDDEHNDGELGYAARSYLEVASGYYDDTSEVSVPFLWPWNVSWWKPADNRVGNYVKAGALIAAEIDRLNRANHV